jgi:uncharacterized membrane-anchored protein YhcB (DUF1043 family)
MDFDIPIWLWVIIPLPFVGGLVLGHLFSTGAKRIKLLRDEVQNTKNILEQTRQELDQARVHLEQARNESARYRQQVTEHFSVAADLFNSLTVNYRAVYEHLAIGSHNLCEEQVILLNEPVPSENLLSKDAEDY